MRRLARVAWVTLLVLSAVALQQWLTWPDVGELASRNPETTAFLDIHRAKSSLPNEPDWRWVGYDRIANSLKRAVIVAEDINFHSHEGFELSEVRTAVRESLTEGRKFRGASTLSQQLVKNLWLSPSRNPWRKVKEALLTRDLERRLSKRRILELYLNVVEFGPGIYGAEAAARRYFGKPAIDLTAGESAALAAGLSRPSSWHPGVESAGYRKRVDTLRRRMDKAAWIERLL